MWTAEVTKVGVRNFNVVATVTITDGTEVITQDIPGVTALSLPVFVQRLVENLEKRDADLPTITVGPLALPRDRVLTKDEQDAADRDAFFVKYVLVQSLNTQVAKGLLDPADPSINAAVVAMKTAFLPEYAQDPRFG